MQIFEEETKIIRISRVTRKHDVTLTKARLFYEFGRFC
jgi:hypothetical protein